MKKEVKKTYCVYRGISNGFDGYFVDEGFDGDTVTFFPAKIRAPEDVFHDYTAEISVCFFAFIAEAQRRGINVVFLQ